MQNNVEEVVHFSVSAPGEIETWVEGGAHCDEACGLLVAYSNRNVCGSESCSLCSCCNFVILTLRLPSEATCCTCCPTISANTLQKSCARRASVPHEASQSDARTVFRQVAACTPHVSASMLATDVPESVSPYPVPTGASKVPPLCTQFQCMQG
jgi:hypothetical protein